MNKQEMKFVARILENLPKLTPEEVQWWIDRPKGLKRLLAGLRSTAEHSSSPIVEFPIWKTLRLGTGLKTADDFRRAIKGQGMTISSLLADDFLLGKPAFTVADAPTEVNLVNISAAEMGLSGKNTLKQIYDRALQLGLKLCSSEVGLQLRLQYTDQPLGEWLLIAMEPIAASSGSLGLFSVGKDEFGVWLEGVNGQPKSVWGARVLWVFVD